VLQILHLSIPNYIFKENFHNKQNHLEILSNTRLIHV